MLSEDREEITEATKAAVQSEFTRIAKEYFETDDVALSLKHGKNGTDVAVTFRASRVKNFTTLK